ncbi:iron-containing alcohol dehydrogenase [Pseudoalteromonas luteoviolacea]|uniref:Aldehyde oxidoreductase n=1 Tax=Pseudoalteromonas luteoviolacea S4054 TaxID=1129367 RepID=A0A0F6ACN7_9GAMM|nr:iron-containing alcohol dehydrogenase [Pseudoalteromonas luteoviolacea]AOT09673.1 aldehyde reductase [Pseudoalteromonas luteoviolacea]AOT14586.1 aldehyde reductase [Pseudoalteromonas luteoviolacea]AOT19500.1 aldehyde reductase [Pseudoalteromonas luteoviolacea]KKE83940.1 aldehyde oxidoreductase [Pseudoalteromonas luteoviolacea S4054]KZN77334.1 aldehyde oxidoreductase [Pseudoalteromonas luteoviolacea S4047-1]
MLNFNFYNPTEIFFGEGQIAEITKAIPSEAKVLVVYGGGSIHKNGIYEQVSAALSEFNWSEFAGIEPNPTYQTCMQAVEKIKAEEFNYILAVGGGSVIDGSKFIAAAANFEGEPWDILSKGAEVKSALPIGVVLTLPATGSESNSFSVVSNSETHDKLPFASILVQPKFAVLDPKVMETLPTRQLTNGVVDAFVHTMEQYLTYPVDAKVQDRFAEGLLMTLMEEGPKLLSGEVDYKVRANVMWSATMALNGLIGAGVPQDWATHMIGHEITAVYGLDHAQTLAIILPRMMSEQKEHKREKLLQYAERVLGLDISDEEQAIASAIELTEQFFHRVDMKTRLSDYGVGEEAVDKITTQLERHGMTALGEQQAVTLDKSRQIIAASL